MSTVDILNITVTKDMPTISRARQLSGSRSVWVTFLLKILVISFQYILHLGWCVCFPIDLKPNHELESFHLKYWAVVSTLEQKRQCTAPVYEKSLKTLPGWCSEKLWGELKLEKLLQSKGPKKETNTLRWGLLLSLQFGWTLAEVHAGFSGLEILFSGIISVSLYI